MYLLYKFQPQILLLEILTFHGQTLFPYPDIIIFRTKDSQQINLIPLISNGFLEWISLPVTLCNMLAFGVLDLHSFTCNKHIKKSYKIKSTKYNPKSYIDD